MLSPLLVIGLMLPIAEFYAFSAVYAALAEHYGGGHAFMTILLSLLLAGMLGLKLIRAQGVRMMFQTQKSLAQGRLPSAELLDGLMLTLAGIALLVPGYLSDLLGLSILGLPFLRRLLVKSLSKRFTSSVHQGHYRAYYGTSRSQRPSGDGHGEIIDVDAVDKKDPLQLP
jgi:UPF0716 protein FxsA